MGYFENLMKTADSLSRKIHMSMKKLMENVTGSFLDPLKLIHGREQVLDTVRPVQSSPSVCPMHVSSLISNQIPSALSTTHGFAPHFLTALQKYQ